MKKSNKNKQAGVRYELELRSLMVSLGFESCLSTRLASRQLDNDGVDLTNTGHWHIQAKWIHGHLSYRKVLERMPADKKPVIFHRQRRKPHVICCWQDDFKEMMISLTGNTNTITSKNITSPWEMLDGYTYAVHDKKGERSLIFMHLDAFTPCLLHPHPDLTPTNQ